MPKTQYLCLIYTSEQDLAGRSETEQLEELRAYAAFNDAARAAGVLVTGEPLQSTDTATTVRVREGKSMLVDGPFAETKEQLGGYYLLACEDQDEAVHWAAQIPAAKMGSVEVRPLMKIDFATVLGG